MNGDKDMKVAEWFDAYDLTSSQGGLVAGLSSFLNQAQKRCFVLKGYAGTGKTFMMKGLAQGLSRSRMSVVLLAPTGRAAKVLQEKTGLPACTIHKHIYSMKDLKEYKEEGRDGTQTFKYYYDLRNNDDDANTVYIVDEASMVSDVYAEAEFIRFGSGFLLQDLLNFINLDANDHNKRILFVGDPAQLPPVGSRHSPALDGDYLHDTYSLSSDEFLLTDVVRQDSGSGILSEATKLRAAIECGDYTTLDIRDNGRDLLDIVVEDAAATLLSESADSQRPVDGAVIIAHTNAKVKEYNEMARERLFPGVSEPCAGDRVLVVHNHYTSSLVLLNGELGSVMEVDPEVEVRKQFINKPVDGKRINVEVELAFRRMKIFFPVMNCKGVTVDCLVCETLLNSKEGSMSSDQTKALYVDFTRRYDGKEGRPLLKAGSPEFREALRNDPYFNCLRIKYGYAMTCHKAQGGEWRTVFVDFATGMGYFNESYFRWAYTAVTRCKGKLYLLNAPRFGHLTPMQLVEESAVSVRDDLLLVRQAMLDEMAAELDSVCGTGENRLARAIYSVIRQSTADAGMVIENVEHLQWAEQYRIISGKACATLQVYYNKKDEISAVTFSNDSDIALGENIEAALAKVKGRRVVIEGTNGDALADVQKSEPVVAFPADAAYLERFHEALTSELHPIGVSVAEVKFLTPFHAWYRFGKGGHEAVVNYYFKKSGRLTRTLPDGARSTSEELLKSIIGLGYDKHEVVTI